MSDAVGGDPVAPVDVRITAGTVITMDPGAATAPVGDAYDELGVLQPGVIEVRGAAVVHVGADPTAAPARRELRLPDAIVLPGLVNTHCHTSQQLARGLADDVNLLTWLHERIWPYEAALSEADAEIAALACACEQIRNGVTLLADPGGQHVDGMARGLAASGIRAVLGRSSMDEGDGLPEAMRESTADVLGRQDELLGRWHGAAGGRLRMGYTLRTIFNCSDELIVASAERAARHRTFVQMHVAEVVEENDHARATRGVSTVRALHALGVLGPAFLAVHVVHVDDHELDLLAHTGTPVSHNAASNLRILAAFPRVADMVDRGVVVGLGTDGAPSNNRMSLIDEMWLAAGVQKALRRDPTALPAPTVLRMVTSWGAAALSAPGLGALVPGGEADLAILDPTAINAVPVHDPLSAITTCLSPANVRWVMCAGHFVLDDGVITTLDESAVIAEAKARGAEVARRAKITPGRSPVTSRIGAPASATHGETVRSYSTNSPETPGP